MNSNPVCLVCLLEEETQIQLHTQREEHVNTWGKDGHIWAKERGLRRNQLDVTLILDFQPPDEKIGFYCLNYPVCGTLLWKPQQTNTRGRACVEGGGGRRHGFFGDAGSSGRKIVLIHSSRKGLAGLKWNISCDIYKQGCHGHPQFWPSRYAFLIPEGPQKEEQRWQMAAISHFPQWTLRSSGSRGCGGMGDGGEKAGSSHLPLPTMIKELNLRIKNQTTNKQTKKRRMLAPDSWDVCETNDFSKLKHLYLPKHRRVLNSLTWDIWFSLINSNLWCWNSLPLFVAYFCITGLHAPPPQSHFLRAT